MNNPITLAGLALAAATSVLTLVATTEPASAADPFCENGFNTLDKKSWILKCGKTVPVLQKGVWLTHAYNANCNTSTYWNFGPSVTAKHLPGNILVRITYICGHVEG